MLCPPCIQNFLFTDNMSVSIDTSVQKNTGELMLCTPVFIMLYYLSMRYNIHVLKIMQLRDINNMSYQKNSKKKLSVKPLTTQVTSFLSLKQSPRTSRYLPIRPLWILSPFRDRDCLSDVRHKPQLPAAYAASTAARLIRSDKVQVLLFRHRGTFAPMSCCTVTGTDFKISRMKYREPIL